MIQDDAVKCRFCGEFLEKQTAKTKWYFNTLFILLTLPLSLPLVWFHPTYKIFIKLIITVAAIITTILIVWFCFWIVPFLIKQFESMGISQY